MVPPYIPPSVRRCPWYVDLQDRDGVDVPCQCECLAPIRCDLLQPVSTSRKSLASQGALELECIGQLARSIESTLVPLWQRHINIALANIEVCWRSYLMDLVPWGVTGAVVIRCLPFVVRRRPWCST